VNTENPFVTVLPTGDFLPGVNMPALDAPEERLRKFKYWGKDASVSMRCCLSKTSVGKKSRWLKHIKNQDWWSGSSGKEPA
jgi:hypothetical protein